MGYLSGQSLPQRARMSRRHLVRYWELQRTPQYLVELDGQKGPSQVGKGPDAGERPCSLALCIDLINDVPYATKYY